MEVSPPSPVPHPLPSPPLSSETNSNSNNEEKPSNSSPSFDLTSILCAAGAKPIELATEEQNALDRTEIDAITRGENGFIPVEDYDESESEEDENEDESEVNDVLLGRTYTIANDDNMVTEESNAPTATGSGSIGEDSAMNTNDSEEVDEKLLNSSSYFRKMWSTIAPKHPPTFSLLLDPFTRTYGCSVSIFIPPSYNSNYTIPSKCLTKKEAKDSVSRMAMKFGEIEKGKKFLESLNNEAGSEEGGGGGKESWELGDKTQDDWEKGWETVENPVGIISEAYKHFGLGDVKFEFRTEQGGNLHGATLTLPLSRTTSETLTSETTFINRQDVKNYLARQVLKTGLLKTVTVEAKKQLELDTGGYIRFDVLDETRQLINPVIHLQKEMEKTLGGIKFKLTTPHKKVASEPDEALYTGSLEISIPRTGFTRKYTSPKNARSPMEIKRVLACIALKEGIIEELREFRAMNGGGEGVPKVAEVRDEDFATMRKPTAYLSSCLQQIAKVSAPLEFEMFVDEDRQYTCEITIQLTSATPPTKLSFKTPISYSSQPQAKANASRLALQSGIINRAREANPFWKAPTSNSNGGGFNGRGGGGGINGRGGGRGRGGSSRGGGLENGGRGGYGHSQTGGGYANVNSNDRDAYNRQPYPGSTANYYDQQCSYNNPYASAHAPAQPQTYSSHYFEQDYYQQQQKQQQQAYPRPTPTNSYLPWTSNTNVVPPVARNLTASEQIDQFCQTMLGRLPIYEPHQDLRTHLYGSVIRIPVSPLVEKTYWVQQDYPRRFDAEEAVARLALDQGIRESVRLALGYPPSQHPSGNPYADRQPPLPQQPQIQQQQHQQSPPLDSLQAPLARQNRYAPYPTSQSSSYPRGGNRNDRGGKGNSGVQRNSSTATGSNNGRGGKEQVKKPSKPIASRIPQGNIDEIKIDEESLDGEEIGKIIEKKIPAVVPSTSTKTSSVTIATPQPVIPRPSLPPPPPPLLSKPTTPAPPIASAIQSPSTDAIDQLKNFCLSNNLDAVKFIEDPLNPQQSLHAIISKHKFELPLTDKNLALTSLEKKGNLSGKILKYLEKQKSLGLLR